MAILNNLIMNTGKEIKTAPEILKKYSDKRFNILMPFNWDMLYQAMEEYASQFKNKGTGIKWVKALNLKKFRELNITRAVEGFKCYKEQPLTYWTTALAGEIGELCNMIKKMERVARGGIDGGSSYTAKDITTDMLKEEVGGIAIYLDLLASLLNISLEDAIIETFNSKSEKYNFKQYLEYEGNVETGIEILKEALESIAESKYPESVFTMTDKEFLEVKRVLLHQGYSIDALSGYYGRIFQKIFINQAKEALAEYKAQSAPNYSKCDFCGSEYSSSERCPECHPLG